MFTELLPILRNRTVLLTIAVVNDDVLRVNVIPRRKTDKESDTADITLSSPLTVTASAEELDRDFARQIAIFSGSFEKAASNLQEIETAHAAAVKAIEEERKKELRNRKPGAEAKAATANENGAPSSLPAKLVFGSKPQSPAAAVNQSLFDANEKEEQPSTEPRTSADRGTTTTVDAAES